MNGIIAPRDVAVRVWARYFLGEERMETLDILVARLIAEFDQAVAEYEAAGDMDAADGLRDARASVLAALDQHGAGKGDPNRASGGAA